MSKILYRYEIEYSSEDGPTDIRLLELPVIRETEKTYFIKRNYWGGERRVLKKAHRTYAFDTKEAAKQHFISRTNDRISWFKYWIEECEKGIKLIKEKS